MRRFLFYITFLLTPLMTFGQVGEHRSDLSIGFNGGYALNSIGFAPKVAQGMHGGITGGFSYRYICEKYFNTICSIYGEVNYANLGWKENIVDIDDQKVVNQMTGLTDEYSRTMSYLQVPIFAHLAWGKEEKGLQVFINLGPQFGYYLNETTETNFTLENMNLSQRANKRITQYSMPVENKFDYGIAVGGGLELSLKHIGHFLLDGRYYYGLGNIYGDSKRDFFQKSNHGTITIKMAYLFDLVKYNPNNKN